MEANTVCWTAFHHSDGSGAGVRMRTVTRCRPDCPGSQTNKEPPEGHKVAKGRARSPFRRAGAKAAGAHPGWKCRCSCSRSTRDQSAHVGGSSRVRRRELELRRRVRWVRLERRHLGDGVRLETEGVRAERGSGTITAARVWAIQRAASPSAQASGFRHSPNCRRAQRADAHTSSDEAPRGCCTLPGGIRVVNGTAEPAT